MISINDISKRFRKKHVFNNLSFEIRKGNFYSLLGKNGIGKSTIINIISGFLKPNEGKVIIDGERTYDNKAFIYKKKIGCLLDKPIYIEKFTIYEYLEFISKLYDPHSSNFHDKINYYLDYFECSDHKDVFIEKCSKGIQQKTSIISILLHDPEYLILDEPFTSLDNNSKQKLLTLLKTFCKNGGAVLLATHDYKYVAGATDYFFIMNKQNKEKLTQIETIRNPFDNQQKLVTDIERLFK